MKYIVICLMAFALHGSVHAMLKKATHNTHNTGAQEKPFGADWPKVEAGRLLEVDSFENLAMLEEWLLPGVLVYSRESEKTYECVLDEVKQTFKENSAKAASLERVMKLRRTSYCAGIPMTHYYVMPHFERDTDDEGRIRSIAKRASYDKEESWQKQFIKVGCYIVTAVAAYKLISFLFDKKK